TTPTRSSRPSPPRPPSSTGTTWARPPTTTAAPSTSASTAGSTPGRATTCSPSRRGGKPTAAPRPWPTTWGSGTAPSRPAAPGGLGPAPAGPGTAHAPVLAYNRSGGPAGGGVAIVGGTFYNPATAQFPSSYVGKYFYEDLDAGWIRVFDPAHPGTNSNPDTSA